MKHASFRSADRAAGFGRRTLLLGGSLAAAGALGCRGAAPPPAGAAAAKAAAFIARGQRYGGGLVATIRDGLLATGIEPAELRGKRVLLKPNLVEPLRTSPHLTTHPAVVVAAAEVFRGWGAQVTVGEGPGHVRDTELALVESGLGEALAGEKLPFEDLNYAETSFTANACGTCPLSGFHLPRPVWEADLVVSLPKLKTHHWVGVTAAMKNLYGVLPGVKYGWPKNVLHASGIPESVVDLYASLPPTLAIVDAIDCMEGDGPILGSPKPMGLLLVGASLPSVDATACRLMQIEPTRVGYLHLAAERGLGVLDDAGIEQRGEAWRPLARPFELLDEPHLRPLRAASGAAASSRAGEGRP